MKKIMTRIISIVCIVTVFLGMAIPTFAIDEKVGDQKFHDNTTVNWLIRKSTMEKQSKYLNDIADECFKLSQEIVTQRKTIEDKCKFLKDTYYYTSSELSKYTVKVSTYKMTIDSVKMEKTKTSYRAYRAELKTAIAANKKTITALNAIGTKSMDLDTIYKIPRLYQTDSKWASTKIGSSGVTIKSVGCLITANAMAESFLAKKNYTPLNFYGSTYVNQTTANWKWAGNYKNKGTFASDKYLAEIYKQLVVSKKPVIVGRVNGDRMHWVLVYACNAPVYKNGKLQFSESDFKILDPATSKRTDLKQFNTAFGGTIRLAFAK